MGYSLSRIVWVCILYFESLLATWLITRSTSRYSDVLEIMVALYSNSDSVADLAQVTHHCTCTTPSTSMPSIYKYVEDTVDRLFKDEPRTGWEGGDDHVIVDLTSSTNCNKKV